MKSSSLLVLTNQSGVTKLEATSEWKALALRPDQLQVDQILFLDVRIGIITHVALLNAITPFAPLATDNGPTLYVPNIAMVMECPDEIAVREDCIDYVDAQLNNGSVLLNHEALTVDTDELYSMAFEGEDAVTDLLVSEIIDQMIINRRSINQSSAISWLTNGGLAALSVQEEHTDHGVGCTGAALDQLPASWVAVGGDQATLALLNSCYNTQPVGRQ